MIVALASPRFAGSVDACLAKIEQMIADAARRGAASCAFLKRIAGLSRARFRSAAESPYFEQAMMMRSRENTIYFASVNYATRFQDSAMSLIAPAGECASHQPYGEEGVLIDDIDVSQSTGLLAKRFAPDRYEEQVR